MPPGSCPGDRRHGRQDSYAEGDHSEERFYEEQ